MSRFRDGWRGREGDPERVIASEWAGGERDVSKIAVFSFTVVRGGFLILYLPVLVPVRASPV